jgi:hypothetical protein
MGHTRANPLKKIDIIALFIYTIKKGGGIKMAFQEIKH